MLGLLQWIELLFLVYLLYRLIDWIIRRSYVRGYKERYILVTGCDTGFGNLLCKRLDRLGCHVFAGCYTEGGVQELSKSCSNNLHALQLDVTKPQSIKNAFQIVKSKLPPGRGLWALLNNAGILGSFGPAEWHTYNDYRVVTDINLFGVINTTLTFLPLLKMEEGRVVSTASVVGRLSCSDTLPYCVAKFGVEGFMDGMRRGMHDFNVKFILIEPGAYNTALWTKTTSKDRWLHLVTKTWEELPSDMQKDYGKVYHEYISTNLIRQCQTILASNRLDDVVDTYEHAILSRLPRGRYVVGKDARLLWIPLTYLPDYLSDLILRAIMARIPKPLAVLRLRNRGKGSLVSPHNVHANHQDVNHHGRQTGFVNHAERNGHG